MQTRFTPQTNFSQLAIQFELELRLAGGGDVPLDRLALPLARFPNWSLPT
jgi:hypothetical protein